MLPDELAKGDKDGYIFTITNCVKNGMEWLRKGGWIYAHCGSRGGGQNRRPRLLQ